MPDGQASHTVGHQTYPNRASSFRRCQAIVDGKMKWFVVGRAPKRAIWSGRTGAPTTSLVTHTHTDHLDPRAIAARRTPRAPIIVPTIAASMLLDISGARTMANGDRLDLGDGLAIEAVPMYNPGPDPKLGVTFHPKGRGNGYVIAVAGSRIYVAGDTVHGRAEGAAGDRRRLRPNEPALHDDARRRGRLCEGHAPAHRLPLPLF